jgi:hypothetical protein
MSGTPELENNRRRPRRTRSTAGAPASLPANQTGKYVDEAGATPFVIVDGPLEDALDLFSSCAVPQTTAWSGVTNREMGLLDDLVHRSRAPWSSRASGGRRGIAGSSSPGSSTAGIQRAGR